MKIVELTIDEFDDISGLDGIALVERPAHESNWLAFEHEKHYQPIYDVLDNTKMGELAFHINQLGEPASKMEEDGYVLYAIQDAVPTEFSKGEFKISSNPNPSWEGDFNPRVRYKYVGQIRPNTRPFCAEMVSAQRVFTEEDIQSLSNLNPVGPTGYNPLMWRGSYNCLHKWVKLTYVPKAELPRILNSANSRRGLISEEVGVLYDTRNDATARAEAEGRSKGVNIGPRVGGFAALDMVDGIPVFSTREEAELLAEKIGCQGSHEMEMEGQIMYMPCSSHDYEFETYNDYPEAASENACKVLRWIDEHGRDEVSGMELTGLQRANSLCKKEKISRNTIGRMAGFERHRKNSEINPEFKGTPWKDKGYVAWLAWGGDEGIAWAQRKVEQLDREEMLYENPCQEGYVAYGTKMKNGKKVPNCVKEEMSKEDCGCKDGYYFDGLTCSIEPGKLSFSANDEKMEITGAAIIPNKFIIRKSAPTPMKPNGEFYYVFFTEKTIKKLAEKYMRNKLLDASNIEHTDRKADSYVKESWIVEDPIFDKSTSLGLEYPKGTWVITMKVNNPKVWEQIKTGKLNGFSVEGWFNENLLFT